MSRIIGRGRYATETYPEGVRGGGSSCAPLSRVFYVDGGTATPPSAQTGSICAPFSTIQGALNAVPPAIFPPTTLPELFDDAIPWVTLIAPGIYNEDLIIPPNRSIVLEGIGGPPEPASSFVNAIPSVLLADVTGISPTVRNVTVSPSGLPLGVTMRNMVFGDLLLTGDGVSIGPNLAGLDRCLISAIVENNFPPNFTAAMLMIRSIVFTALTPNTNYELRDSFFDAADVKQIQAWDSLFQTALTAFAGEIHDCRVQALSGTAGGLLYVYDCQVSGSLFNEANLSLDSATLNYMRRSGSPIPPTSQVAVMADEALTWNAAVIYDAGDADVTIGRDGVNPWAPNTYLLSPLLAGTRTVNLCDLADWEGPDTTVAPMTYSRVLVIKNRGAGTVNVQPFIGQRINLQPIDTPISVAAGTSVRLIAVPGVTPSWETID